MPERLHSLSTRTDTMPAAPVARCQPHCQESRLLESTFAIRMGWLKLRRTPRAGSRDQQAPNFRRCRRCVTRFARLGVSAGLALALFGPPSALVRAGYGPLGAAFRVNTTTAGDQEYPAIAANASGNYVAVWQGPDENSFARDIYAQRYSSSGAPLGVEFRVNTYTTGDQRVPAVAIDAAGDFVVAWQSFGQDGDGDGIFAQRYGANGTPLGAEFQVNSFTTSFQGAPAVAMDSAGDFVVAWQSFGQDGDSNGIYAQRYAADGNQSGAEFPVSTFTTGSQEDPAVAIDAAGDFVVAWQSAGQDGSAGGIYAQRYTSAGAQSGGEFGVTTYTTNDQVSPSVASDAAGDFTIVWTSSGQDGSGSGIYEQRYSASGATIDGELRVNTYTTDMQYAPAVAMDAAGDTVVVWESINQNGHLDGVYAQRYGPSGAPSGDEFNLAVYSTGGHAVPTIAMDAAGDFVAGWEIYDTSGSGWDIYARQYSLAAVHIAAPAGGAHVVEGGATASYSLSLSTIPTLPVSVTLTPANAQLDLGSGAGNPRVLTFAADTSALISQTLTVAAVDDKIAQGDRTVAISVTVASGDAGYTGANVPIIVNGQSAAGPLLVAIGDNDVSYKRFVPLVQR